MKTTIVLLMIALSILKTCPTDTVKKVIENTKVKSMIINSNNTYKDCLLHVKEDIMAKADSSNHYLFIVSKRTVLIQDQLCSVTLSETDRRLSHYQNVDKIVDDYWTEGYFTEYLEKNYSESINLYNVRS